MDQTPRPPVNQKGTPPAIRVAGHFGELVQGRVGADGPVALVTLRCPCLISEAQFAPEPGALVIEATPSNKLRRAADLALQYCREIGFGLGGRLSLKRNAMPGAGAGSSTADILAAIRAISQAVEKEFTPEEEAAMCLEAEGAVDPLMFPGEVLFASREARVLEHLPPLPAMQVIGGFAGEGRPTNPEDQDFPDMAQAFDLLRDGLATGDPKRIAEAARRSAEANQARNPNPAWHEVLKLCDEPGVLGPVVSHTGSAIGVLVKPGHPLEALRTRLNGLGLQHILDFKTRAETY